jgi:hypothetical protein
MYSLLLCDKVPLLKLSVPVETNFHFIIIYIYIVLKSPEYGSYIKYSQKK